MPKLNPKVLAERNKIKAKIRAIKDAGLLPHGYGKKVQELANERRDGKGKEITVNKVNQVAGGHEYHEIVVDVILELAAENKLSNQLAKANEILS